MSECPSVRLSQQTMIEEALLPRSKRPKKDNAKGYFRSTVQERPKAHLLKTKNHAHSLILLLEERERKRLFTFEERIEDVPN